jgi:hypothetical protein
VAVRAFVVTLAFALTLVPAAAAHPRAEGFARGFQSKILSVRPEVAGLTVSVVDLDDRLRVANESGRELVVRFYERELYLRIGPAGVFRNERSPASFLNRDRFARVPVPVAADPRAKPVWRRVSARPVWQWHDHRIQWMGEAPPAQVAAAPRETHVIFPWQVPARLGGRQLVVDGRLDYVPPDEDGASAVVVALVAITGVAAAVGVGLVVLARNR